MIHIVLTLGKVKADVGSSDTVPPEVIRMARPVLFFVCCLLYTEDNWVQDLGQYGFRSDEWFVACGMAYIFLSVI